MFYSVLHVGEFNAKTIILKINLICVNFKPVKSSILNTSRKCYAISPTVLSGMLLIYHIYFIYSLNLHVPPMAVIKCTYHVIVIISLVDFQRFVS